MVFFQSRVTKTPIIFSFYVTKSTRKGGEEGLKMKRKCKYQREKKGTHSLFPPRKLYCVAEKFQGIIDSAKFPKRVSYLIQTS